MAQTKGSHITNFDSQPHERVLASEHGGVRRGILETYEFPDSANADTAILAKLPVDATLPSIKMAFDDLGTAGTIDIGFFKRNADGTYTVVSAAAIANNIDVNAAAVAMTDYRYSVKGIETIKQKIWELAGLSARPDYGDLYIGLTSDAGTTVVGTVALDAVYQE